MSISCLKKSNYFKAIFYCHVSGCGVTAGRHRYFSHRSFKGNRAVDILLAMMACTTFEQSIYTWCRDHRLHHKHSETDADPYNSNRGNGYQNGD